MIPVAGPNNMETNKQHVEQLLGQLAPQQLAAVVANAPFEDEEISAATAAELDASHASIKRGEGISHEEIMREYGLTPRR